MKKFYFLVIIFLIIGVFIYLINSIYSLTLNDAKKNHQRQQLEMAKAVSQGIGFFLEHIKSDFNLLTSNSELSSDTSERENLITDFHNNYDNKIISSIILVDSDGKIIFNTGPRLSVQIENLTKDGLNKFNSDLSASFYVSDIESSDSQNPQSIKVFLILLRLNNLQNDTYIACLINFDSLIEHFITPLKLSNSDFAWILDSGGRLIYHPRHSEMLFKSIFEFNKECKSCHDSFEIQKNIIQSDKASVGEYKITANEPSKIFAFEPIKLGKQKWFLVVSTFLPEVVSGLKDKFRLFFVLGVVIVLTIAFFVSIIYYLNIRRVKAEESSKNFEKIQEYQERLNHSSKLATVGELVDSVAHEINTPAGIILANTDAILMQKKYSESISELEIIKNQVKRISTYTRSLLNFSKRISFEPKTLNLVDVINESVFLLNHKLKEKKIKLIKDFAIKDSTLLGDKRQLEQVFLNLLLNSIEAISNEGEILIRVQEHSGNQNNDSLKISIKDNGKGIEEDQLDKIFGAFYSSGKDTGTGLGLSITKSIIQKHRGSINVESESGSFTLLSIVLPRRIN